MPQHKTGMTPPFTRIRPLRTNLVQNPWDYHGTESDDFLGPSLLCSPLKPGTCIMKVTLRVVSNLSFTATFLKKSRELDAQRDFFCPRFRSLPPSVPRSSGAFWALPILIPEFHQKLLKRACCLTWHDAANEPLRFRSRLCEWLTVVQHCCVHSCIR